MQSARISSFIALPILGLVGFVGAACSVDLESSPPTGSPSSTTSSTVTPPTPTADAAPSAPDASTPDVKKPIPTTPYFDVTVNGVKMTVKSVTSRVANIYPDQGTSYYELTATLERTPPMVAGLQNDPTIVIRVGKDDKGVDACKEVRGPAVGAVEPVTQIRDVQIKYGRFNGSSTVYASPSTIRGGACTMTLEAPSTDGHAWGAAKGSVQSGTDEPKLDFDISFFEPIVWK